MPPAPCTCEPRRSRTASGTTDRKSLFGLRRVWAGVWEKRRFNRGSLSEWGGKDKHKVRHLTAHLPRKFQKNVGGIEGPVLPHPAHGPDGPQVQFWNLIRCHLYLAVSNEKNSNPAMILTRSTILISNRPLEEWGKLIGGVPAASAILDRFVHHAHIIKIKRTSYQLLILIELPVGVGTY